MWESLQLELPSHFTSENSFREKPYACSECWKAFNTKSNLIVHHKTHTGEKPYGCNVCGKSFTLKLWLIVHQGAHTGVKPIDVINVERLSVWIHTSLYMREVTQDWNSMDAMNVGKLLGVSPTSLYIWGLTGEKPHEYREWRKSFSINSQLIVCQRIHTGENLYVWNECEEAFNIEDQLISHQWTHTGEKSDGCNECGKTFSSKSYLIINMRTHSGKKPYECHKFEKAFIWKSLLTVHEWTHAGENPYEYSQHEKIFQWKIMVPCISEDGNETSPMTAMMWKSLH